MAAKKLAEVDDINELTEYDSEEEAVTDNQPEKKETEQKKN